MALVVAASGAATTAIAGDELMIVKQKVPAAAGAAASTALSVVAGLEDASAAGVTYVGVTPSCEVIIRGDRAKTQRRLAAVGYDASPAAGPLVSVAPADELIIRVPKDEVGELSLADTTHEECVDLGGSDRYILLRAQHGSFDGRKLARFRKYSPTPHFQRTPTSIGPSICAYGQWGLEAIGAPSQGIRAPGSPIVAVIDSGIDFAHPDLAHAKGEPSTVNFVGEPSDFADSSGHGTQMAGIIAAAKTSPKGIFGVAPNAKLMALKVGDSQHANYPSCAIARAFQYAAKQRVSVVNASFAGPCSSPPEADAVALAVETSVVVAAVGNSDGRTPLHCAGKVDDNDCNPYYPASYPGVVSVLGIEGGGALWHSTRYGRTTVQLGAPGERIKSTYPGATYRCPDGGSSPATAFVSGVAAALWGRPELPDAAAVRCWLIDPKHVTDVPKLHDWSVTGGIVSFQPPKR